MYNVRIIHYPDGDQITFFSSPIRVSDDFYDFDPFTGEIVPKKVISPSPVLVTDFNPFFDMEVSMVDLDFDEYKKLRSSRVSISRTKNKVYYLARSNTWEWFVTLTFNPDLVDSFDYAVVTDKLSKWLNNLKSRYAPDLKYIIVPEKHKSGRFHFHGLFAYTGNIAFVDSGRTSMGHIVFNVGNYRLGFSTATKIVSVEKSVYYVTKYLSKDLFAVTKGKKRYWASKNLTAAPISYIYAEKASYDKAVVDLPDVRFSKSHDFGYQSIGQIVTGIHDSAKFFN